MSDVSMSPEAISRMIADGVAADVAQRVRCELHEEAPTIAIVQAEPDGLEYAISGCCDDLRKKARKAIDDLLGAEQPASRETQHGSSDEYSMR